MITPSSLEKAETYLRLHLIDTGRRWTSKPTGPYVTVSREAGTNGSAFAAALAHELEGTSGECGAPWTVFDGELVEEMLRSARLSPGLARFLPEDRVSEFNSNLGEVLGLHPNLWELNQRAIALVRQLACAGHSILVGRGANFATSGIPHGLHLRLVGSVTFRAHHAAARFGLSRAQAMEQNREKDLARRRFVRSMFNTDVTEPAAYDILLNVESIPQAEAVRLVADLLLHRSQVPA